jgi:hypothetical protein
MKARNHHYLSQCYLKGFTKGGSKKSKLTVIDFKEKKRFETIPRNVGGIRDFNRIEIEGVDQNAIETALGNFEGQAASALKQIEETLTLDGKNRNYILNLIALLAIRSPEQRENRRQIEAQVAERIMDMSLETKERWDSEMAQMEAEGYKPNENVTYEKVKAFHENKDAYTFHVSTERHIRVEISCIDTILKYLNLRN